MGKTEVERSGDIQQWRLLDHAFGFLTTENCELVRELVDLIRNAEQSRTHCDSPDFYCRRLEECERTF